MKVLVTGGGGFLGRAVAERLQASGHVVTVAGRSRYPALERLGIVTLPVDVADADAVYRAVEGHDAVVHAAARAGVWGPRDSYRRTNVDGTRHVVDACRAARVGRLVFTSSPSVVFDGRDHHGAGPDLPYPGHYDAVYPETKAEAERIVLGANDGQLATVALRPHIIWGPGDPHLLPRVFARARARRLRIVGDGRNRVSVTYVANAAAAHVQALDTLRPGSPAAGRAFFVNDPEPVELWTWLNDLLRALGLPTVERRVPLPLARAAGLAAEAAWTVLPLSGEPPMTRFVASQLAASHWYDPGPARAAFGYDPPVGARQAFDETVAWWRAELARGTS